MEITWGLKPSQSDVLNDNKERLVDCLTVLLHRKLEKGLDEHALYSLHKNWNLKILYDNAIWCSHLQIGAWFYTILTYENYVW